MLAEESSLMYKEEHTTADKIHQTFPPTRIIIVLRGSAAVSLASTYLKNHFIT